MRRTLFLFLAAVALMATAAVPASGAGNTMADGVGEWEVDPVFTVGETIPDTSGALNPTSAGDFTPVGVLDGLGAYELDAATVRVFANHELLHFRGYDYEVSDGSGGTFTMAGARITYFDIDKESRTIVDSGIATNTIYDANGNVATDSRSDPTILPASAASVPAV